MCCIGLQIVHYTCIVWLHLCKRNTEHPKNLYPNEKCFLCIAVFKTSKPMLSQGLLEFSWVFLLLVRDFCISRMWQDRVWSQDNFKKGSILNYLNDSVSSTHTNQHGNLKRVMLEAYFRAFQLQLKTKKSRFESFKQMACWHLLKLLWLHLYNCTIKIN